VLELVGLENVARKRAGSTRWAWASAWALPRRCWGTPESCCWTSPSRLDPEGIIWVRTLLRSLAAEGRTVFVSSHLMAEMALTADHLVVIGRGD